MRPDSRPQQQRRHRERGAVCEQGQAAAEDRDDHAACREPGHDPHLPGDLRGCQAERVAVTGQDRRIQGGAGALERGVHRRDREEQEHHGPQRHTGQHHDGHEHHAHEVTGDHDVTAGVTVRQAGQREPADQPWQVAGGICQRGQQRRSGALVDQHGERDPGELVPGDRRQVREPDSPELATGEHLAERHPGRLRGLRGVCCRAGHRTSCPHVTALRAPWP